MNCKHFLKSCPICGTSQVSYKRTLNSIELLKCSACDFVYANLKDQYIKAENSKFDENDIAGYEGHQTFIHTMWFKRIVKKLTNVVGSGRVLDIGCGNGILLKYFLDQQWLAYGVDLSPWAKKFARIYGYTLYSCELENSGLPSNYFDVVTSTSTLEHVAQPCQHVREIVRVLKPGGIAYFAGIPNYGSLSVRLNMSDFYSNMPPRHVNYFTYKSVYRLFSNSDIADDIKKLSIISYGIPESHRIYYFIRKLMQKITTRSKDNFDESATSGFPLVLKKALKTLAPILTAIHYSLGRPFHLGDKLEVIAIKR